MYTLSSLVKVVNPTRAAQPPHNTMKFLIKFNSIGKPILDADERAAQALAPRAQIFWIKKLRKGIIICVYLPALVRHELSIILSL
jgi:hypothetical protein